MGFNVEQALVDAGVSFTKREYKYNGSQCTRFELKECFFDKAHSNNDACIFQYESGAWAYKCQHDSCHGKDTQSVREKLRDEYGLDLKKYWSGNASGEQNDHRTVSYMSFQQIYDTPVILNYIIQDMMAERDSVLIHAPGGVGKSMFWLYLVLFLASVRESDLVTCIFDEFVVPKPRCSLIVQSENSQAALYTRIRIMCKYSDTFTGGLNRIFILGQYGEVTLTGEVFSDREFRDFLVAFIGKIETEQGVKIDILVIDPLISYHGGNENDAVETREVLDGIDEVTRRSGCTAIVIHHARKDSGEYRGSTAINDWTRNRISITRNWMQEAVLNEDEKGEITTQQRNIPILKVTQEKCNNFQPFEPFLLRMGSDLKFKRISKDDFIPPDKAENFEKVAQALHDLPEQTAKSTNQLIKCYQDLAGVGKTAARDHISAAVEHGYINRESITVNGTQTYEYKLPD